MHQQILSVLYLTNTWNLSALITKCTKPYQNNLSHELFPKSANCFSTPPSVWQQFIRIILTFKFNNYIILTNILHWLPIALKLNMNPLAQAYQIFIPLPSSPTHFLPSLPLAPLSYVHGFNLVHQNMLSTRIMHSLIQLFGIFSPEIIAPLVLSDLRS